MKIAKIIITTFILLTIMGGCVSTNQGVSRHPVVRDRTQMMSTELRVSIFVADNIDTPRLGNYNLRRGNNYLRVPAGTHVLYWSKKGESYRKSIKVSEENKRFGVF